MSGQAGFVTYCSELLAPLGEVRSRRMFGGHGMYVGDVFVGIVRGDALYLKGDEETRRHFEAAGSLQFAYTRQGRRQSAAFWAAPAEAMDSLALMAPWARLALEAARRARAGP